MSEFDDPISGALIARRQQSSAAAMGWINADPEQAARSIELSGATGVPAPVIDGDLENFETQHKSKLAGEIIRGNPHIAEYIASNPMAAKVSNDDYGNLDEVSSQLQKFKYKPAAQAAWEGFKEGFGDQPVGSWANNPDLPIASATYGVLGSPVEVGMRLLSGAITGAIHGIGQDLSNETGIEWFTKIAPTIAAAAQDPALAASLNLPHLPSFKPADILAHNERLRQEIRGVEPYLEANQHPPYGINDLADRAIKEQSKRDLAALSDALAAAVKSPTRERAPDLFAGFVRQHTGDQTIGVSADAVRRLYGDKPPTPEDGKLGFVNDLAGRLARAEAYGGDIEIPVADWLAKVEPDVARELKDDLRVRSEGVTNEEKKLEAAQVKESIDSYHGSPAEFEAFDSRYIGSGEGAQAIAYGHYVAENNKVAKDYQEKLGLRALNLSDADTIHRMTKEGRTDEEIVTKLLSRGNTYGKQELEAYKRGKQGNLYKTRIKRDPEEFLDWDKDLTAQPAGKLILEKMDPAFRDTLEEFLESHDQPALDALTGREFHRLLERFATEGEIPGVRGDYDNPHFRREASEYINNLGVPGVKFLDQVSRQNEERVGRLKEKAKVEKDFVAAYTEMGDASKAAEAQAALDKLEGEIALQKPTSNFVVFNDADLEIIERNGEAVRAVRESAQLKPLEDIAEGQWLDYGGPKALTKDRELYTANEHALVAAVDAELARIVPKQVDVFHGSKVKFGDKDTSAVHISFEDRKPIILWSLDSSDAIGDARHEALHHLRQQGFFTDREWRELSSAAVSEGWFEKYEINERYGHLKLTERLEEAVAEGFRDWSRDPRSQTSTAAKVFAKLRDFLDSVKDAISKVLGREPNWKELFDLADQGVVGQREGNKPRREGNFKESKPPQGELDVTRMEDREVFARAEALGMTEVQYRRYQKLIDKRRSEDAAHANAKLVAEERKKQTAEWKAATVEVRKAVVEDIAKVPDLAADAYFREGIVDGRKTEDRTKLGREFLTQDQIDGLHKSTTAERGVRPDDIAPLFGYPSGAAMVDGLVRLEGNRRTAGMGPEPYRRRVIEIETERRMQATYGKLDENIIQAAKEQVLSETQLDLLHEETVALAEKAGAQLPIGKVELRDQIVDGVNKALLDDVSSDKLLAAAGRAGRAVEDSLLKGDFSEAFRQRQRQYIAITAAKEAVAVEKLKEQFDRVAKRFSRKEVSGVDQEYTNYIQALLLQAGSPVRRSVEDVRQGIAFSGTGSLEEFVRVQKYSGWDPAVSDQLMAEGAKPLEKMTVEEFKEFKNAIDSMAFIGREVNKIEIAGEKADFAEFRQGVIDNIKTLPLRSREGQGKWFYKYDAAHTRTEELIKDLDLRQELGPLYKAVMEPMLLSKSKSFDLLTDLSKHFQATRGSFDKKWRKSLQDTIPQSFIIDPVTKAPYDLTRENMIQIMLNWGNESNKEKFSRGAASVALGRIATKEEGAHFAGITKAMIDQHATADDWKFVQRLWEPFKNWQPMMDQVARNTSGVAPKWIAAGEVETPHGKFDGGYWPVKYDRLGSDISVIEEKTLNKDHLFGPQYFRAATSKGHLKDRTGYVDFVDISRSIEQAAGVMQQTIHDIAYRDALIQANKVLSDRAIRNAIRNHYGTEYEAQLEPWLKRVANQYSADDKALAGINDFFRRVRINLVGHALPLNLKVIGSPDIGVPNPKAWTSFIANYHENSKLAMEKSNEIRHQVYNMDRDFTEQLERITVKKGLGDFQKKAIEWGFAPITKVSQQFRMSTFVDQYNRALARGKTDVEAVGIADSYVRERHGAASVVDLPAVMQSNEALKALTMFYGYFNTMYNWQRQIPGQLRRGEWANASVTALGSIGVSAAFGAALFNNSKESDSWFKIIGKALVMAPMQSAVGLNQLASYAFEGFPWRTPTESLFNAAGALKSDVLRRIQGKPMKNPVKNVANVIGMTTGLPLAQIGRTGEFLHDVATREQRPRNFLEWYRGIVQGEAKLKP